jgi:hypothetical protein
MVASFFLRGLYLETGVGRLVGWKGMAPSACGLPTL